VPRKLKAKPKTKAKAAAKKAKAPAKKATTIRASVTLREHVEPIDRGDRYEDPVFAALAKAKLGGQGDGGGTLCSKDGEIEEADFDVVLRSPEAAAIVTRTLESAGAAKGATLEYTIGKKTTKVRFGITEGIAIYLDGVNLPAAVYTKTSAQELLDKLTEALGEDADFRGSWQGPRETALYMYGLDAEALFEKMRPVLTSYPLCKNARVVLLCCLYRNVTGQPPCYPHGQEPGRHVEEAFPPSVHHRTEGRGPASPHGRQGPGLGLVQRAGDPAQRLLPMAASGPRQPRRRADEPRGGGAEQAREAAHGSGRRTRGQARQEGRCHRRDRRGVHAAKKRSWGALTGRWVPHDTRDTVVDFVRDWSAKTEIPSERFIAWIGVARGKFFDWRKRYGKANEHNALVPRDHWLTDDEKQAIVEFHDKFPLEGYRRLTFMMIDQDVAAASPSSVYRVLSGAGLLDRWNPKPSKKGTGFVQPLRAHEHWHIDVAYLNLGGTFYYLCSILDGASRSIVHWEIREAMTEEDVECILLRAREQHPNERPRVISDNGPQFIAKDFKEFIRLTGMTHVRTAPYYPQSNGKIERWHKTIKADAIRPGQPTTVDEARALVARWVEHYNTVRLHSAIGYITPADFLAGRSATIWAERDRKLDAAREARAACRAAAYQEAA
jgi:transposase InsO family protein